MKHLLPVAFQDVRRFMDSYRGRNPHIPLFNLEKDQHGFRENCLGIFQPDVNFSHDSLWHAGWLFYHKRVLGNSNTFLKLSRAKIIFAFLYTCMGKLLQTFNPFIPQFLKWTIPFLNMDLSTDANRSLSLKSKTEWQKV